jgi:glycine hydroxymethyltransferase
LRIWMQAMTTRGVKEDDTKHIARFIHEAIQNRNDDEKLRVINAEVVECCRHFPIPAI